MGNDTADTDRLFFLASRQLKGPLVDRAEVWARAGRRLGAFEGVVIDPTVERARYIVVDGGRLVPDWRLIPLPARMSSTRRCASRSTRRPKPRSGGSSAPRCSPISDRTTRARRCGVRRQLKPAFSRLSGTIKESS